MTEVTASLLSIRSEVRFKIAMLRLQRSEEEQVKMLREAETIKDRVEAIFLNHAKRKNSFKYRYRNAQSN